MDLIPQNIGNGAILGYILMAAGLILGLKMFWPLIKRLNRHLDRGALIMCNELVVAVGELFELIKESRLHKRMRNDWLAFQTSVAAPIRHRGWHFMIGKDNVLEASLVTLAGRYLITTCLEKHGAIRGYVFTTAFFDGVKISTAHIDSANYDSLLGVYNDTTARMIGDCLNYDSMTDLERAEFYPLKHGMVGRGTREDAGKRIPHPGLVPLDTPKPNPNGDWEADTKHFLDAISPFLKTGTIKGGKGTIPHLLPNQSFNDLIKSDLSPDSLVRLIRACRGDYGDTQEATDYLIEQQTTVMQSGYKIKDGAVFCPHHKNTAEASKFCTIAASKLVKAGIPAGYLKFSFPDREAVAEPCTNPRHEMLAAIQTQLAQYDLKTLKNVTDDNCADCPYEEGSALAKQFARIVNRLAMHYGVSFAFNYPSSVVPFLGKKQEELPESTEMSDGTDTPTPIETDEVILAQSDLYEISAPVTNTENLVGEPPEEEENAFILKVLLDEGYKVLHDGGMAFVLGLKSGRWDYKIMIILGGDANRTRSPRWLIASASVKANSGTDSHKVLLKQQKDLTADTPLRPCILSFALTMSEAIDTFMESPEANTEPHPIDIKPDGDDTPPVLRKFDVNDGWDWEQIPNKVAGRTCFQKEMHGHEYIIVIDAVNVHESDADQDGNLMHVMATLLIAPENWTDFTQLRRLWRSEETIEVDADMTECENYVGTNLEDVARKLNGALNFKLDGFYSALHCPFDDSTEEQRLAAHATVTKTLATGDFTTATDDETGGESE